MVCIQYRGGGGACQLRMQAGHSFGLLPAEAFIMIAGKHELFSFIQAMRAALQAVLSKH